MPTNDTRALLALIPQLLPHIWRDEQRYQTGGVMLAGFTPVGMQQGEALHVQTDRAAAIAEAIARADACDVVLIAGKGHEDYQETKGVRHPFSDMDEAQKALAVREGKKRS